MTIDEMLEISSEDVIDIRTGVDHVDLYYLSYSKPKFGHIELHQSPFPNKKTHCVSANTESKTNMIEIECQGREMNHLWVLNKSLYRDHRYIPVLRI